KKGDESVLTAARELRAELEPAARVLLDDRAEHSAPWKFNEWEMRGVPLRIEIGPRDIAAGSVTIARRDTPGKSSVPRSQVVAQVGSLLAEIQARLLARARADRDARSPRIADRAAFVEALKAQAGFVLAAWCEAANCEAALKAETSAVSRVIVGAASPGARCAYCGEPAVADAYFARSY
ncbi:MAG: His/Gly/Thr/Pro-type tRNA ligase C-terminal domain-containing protein, partial [Candidatus Eremiobacteraeota bacterium]|nr:His/Gly/Thr/Pro-type tRNA ligase C-terminal domain-containing protein [Candidatus Eremiobacteraeota bacterium]